jgi:hypothetical protein
MSSQASFFDTPNATSSPASVSGPTPSAAPAGPTISPAGRVPHPANLSARQAAEKGLLTSGTYGRRSITSSESAALQSSLESKLTRRLSSRGSTLFTLIRKRLITPLARSYFLLRASARRTDDTGPILWDTPTDTDIVPEPDTTADPLSGWITPAARDWKDSENMALTGTNPDGTERSRIDQLPRQALLSGWPTPAANEFEIKDVERMLERQAEQKAMGRSGNGFGFTLAMAAKALASWPTPTSGTPNSLRGLGQDPEKRMEGGHQVNLQDAVRLAAWPTTRATDGEKNVRTDEGAMREMARKGSPQDLNQAAILSSWPTPATADAQRGAEEGKTRISNGAPTGITLGDTARLGTWPTPRVASDRTSAGAMDRQDSMAAMSMEQVAEAAMWIEPREISKLRPETRERMGFTDTTAELPGPARLTVSGELRIGSSAEMESGGPLNPGHSRWLQGLPVAWDEAAPLQKPSKSYLDEIEEIESDD